MEASCLKWFIWNTIFSASFIMWCLTRFNFPLLWSFSFNTEIYVCFGGNFLKYYSYQLLHCDVPRGMAIDPVWSLPQTPPEPSGLFLVLLSCWQVTSSCTHCPCILSFPVPNWLLLICYGMNTQLTSLLAERVGTEEGGENAWMGNHELFYYMDFVSLVGFLEDFYFFFFSFCILDCWGCSVIENQVSEVWLY